jgi:hypothetical protein
MRYMMLVYSTADPDGLAGEEAERIRAGHQKVIAEAGRKGVLIAAEPLAPIGTATTVRMSNGEALVIDGPFAETKEHLAGYYIMDCKDLDEAIEWASKIPTECQGRHGCIEIRPTVWQTPATGRDHLQEAAAPLNG